MTGPFIQEQDDEVDKLCRRIVRLLGSNRHTAMDLKTKIQNEYGPVSYPLFCQALKMLMETGFIVQLKPIGGGVIREICYAGVGLPADSKE